MFARCTLNINPTPTKTVTIDDPPKLMNGSAIPVGGTSASMTAMLSSAFEMIHSVTPAANSAPNGSGVRRAMVKPQATKIA